jgi:cation diffusion facilitator family transporter
VVNLVLGAFKVAVGYLAKSVAVGADGLQSLTCALVALLVAQSMKLGRRRPDARFPYGYGKAEFVVSFFSQTFLCGLGLFMLVSAGYLLTSGRADIPHPIALPVAFLSVVANRMLYQACGCAAKRTNSVALAANADQNRADMLSSCAVVLGVAIATAFPSLAIFDTLAAGTVALLIVVDALRAWIKDARILADGALPGLLRRRVQRMVRGTSGVVAVKFIDARHLGQGYWLDIGVGVAPDWSVSDADHLATRLRADLLRSVQAIEGVEVYAYAEPSMGVPAVEGPSALIAPAPA